MTAPPANLFKCADCGETFINGWSESEVLAERFELWGEIPPGQVKVVCDVCFQKVLRDDEVLVSGDSEHADGRGARPGGTAGGCVCAADEKADVDRQNRGREGGLSYSAADYAAVGA
jgi:hypothetical protein